MIRARTPLSAVGAMALLLSACGVPSLSVTGEIRCARDRAGGGCPPEYSCVFGRCCPSASVADGGFATCPAASFVATDGSVKCVPGSAAQPGRCPSGFSCRFDRCCPSDGSGTGLCAPSRLGSPCEGDQSCNGPSADAGASGLRCFRRSPAAITAAPGGVCLRPTGCLPSEPNACGDGNVCIQGECLPRCTVPVGTNRVACREGGTADAPIYSCRRISADPTTTEGYCFLDCGRMNENGASVCVNGSICNGATGQCVIPCVNEDRSRCPNAAFVCSDDRCIPRYIPCGDDDDCGQPDASGERSIVCRPHPSWTGPAEAAKVCVLNRSEACVSGTPCLDAITDEDFFAEFPCIQGVCIVRFGTTQ